jgi:hypothetical protein
MSAYDLKGRVKVTHLLDAQTLTADGTPANGVDMTGYNGLVLMANVGESGDTLSGSVYLELQVQHSDDDSTYTAATDAMLSTAVTGSATGTAAKIDAAAEDSVTVAVGVKDPTQYRYWRMIANLTGTHTNGIPVGIDAIQGAADILPAA